MLRKVLKKLIQKFKNSYNFLYLEHKNLIQLIKNEKVVGYLTVNGEFLDNKEGNSFSKKDKMIFSEITFLFRCEQHIYNLLKQQNGGE